MSADERVLEGHEPPGRDRYYVNLPFEVPPGVGRIDVHYSYSDAIGSDLQLIGGNCVDIGLFDWRGADFPAAGFRGWSGSARSHFFLTATEATPGYLPGPLTPGTWYVCLGFYKVGPRGCDYQVTVRFTEGDAAGAGFPVLLTLDTATSQAVVRPDGWYRGELHCHTLHSDGDSSAREVIAAAEALGLDFLAIMDHNNVTHLAEMATLGPQRLTLIPGYEVTTYRGHWNAWGADRWIDFRVQTPEQMAEALAVGSASGALTSCNHPRPFGPPWAYEDVGGFHCVEVWNGPWRLANSASLRFWEDRLRAGQRLVAVGGSDMHRLKSDSYARLGLPTTWIYCPGAPTAAALLAGLRAGHAFVSDGPDGPRLELASGSARMGDCVPRPASNELAVQIRVAGGAGLRLEILGSNGLIRAADVTAEDEWLDWRLPVSDTNYLRAQLVDPDAADQVVHALTNPIYLDAP